MSDQLFLYEVIEVLCYGISLVMAEYTTKDPMAQAKGELEMSADELRLAQMGMLLQLRTNDMVVC